MENALGGAIDASMTADMVARLVDQFPRESEFVEYKSKRALLAKRDDTKAWRFECGKDVATLANARGGVLIFGVRDAKNVAPGGDPLQPFTADDGDPHELVSTFRTAASSVTSPPPGFEMFPVHRADGEAFFLVCVVPPSERAPHAVTRPGDGREGLVFPSRIDGQADAVYLREFQVAELYERRARSGVDRRRRVETVWADGCAALAPSSSPPVWIAVASIPDHAGDDLLDPRAHHELQEWADDEQVPTLIQHGFIGLGHWVPAPGRICLVQTRKAGETKYEAAVQDFYSEVHADGSMFVAVPVSAGNTAPPFTIEVDDIVDVVASGTTHALRWTAHRTGLWGSTTVTAGVVVAASPFSPAVQIKDFGGLSSGRQISRQLTRNWPRSTTVVELAGTGAVNERLAAAYRLATPLVQAFGVPDLYWLNQSGQLLVSNVRYAHQENARNWWQRNRP